MKVLYLHVGMPKTGTTALQSFLAKNMERLYEDGIWYPELTASSRAVKKQKVFTSNADFLPRFKENFEDMSEEAREFFDNTCKKLQNSDKDILLSCEMGVWKTDIVCKNFMARGFDVKVIVFLRRQDLWFESVWNHYVKGHACTERCFDFIQGQDIYVDYYKRLKEIAAVIGKDNVIISVYGEATEDIFTTFLGLLGINDAESYQKDKYQSNPSLTANFVEIKRIFNSIPGGPVFISSISDVLDIGKKYALMNEEIVHAPSFLSREERLAIIEKYHEGNTMLAKEFLGRDTLFDETIEDNDKYGVDRETIYEDIIKFFGMISIRQHEEIERIKEALYKFEIPEECIGKRIVVYGIDSLGSRLYRQLEKEEMCKELVAVDRRWMNMNAEKVYNIPIGDPQMVHYEDIDYVLIAVENEKTYEAIASYLVNTKNLKPQQILRMRLSER